MELDFLIVDSLFRKSCISFMSSLWNMPQIKNHVKSFLLADHKMTIADIEKYIYFSIMRNKYLPEVMKFHLKNFIQPMKRQILHFADITRYLFQLYADSSVNISFIWSDKGVLIFSKTAEVIVHSNSNNVMLCFSLACKFCLENIIYQLEKTVKQHFSPNVIGIQFFHSMHGIINFWLQFLFEQRVSDRNIEDRIISIITVENLVCFSSEINDISVIKFFVEKLNQQKRLNIVNELLFCICRKTRPRDGLILRYLLSNLDFGGIEFARNNAYKVLLCFLEWPCLDLFLPAANKLWNYLSSAEYLHLTLDIVECIHSYNMTYDYQNLFYHFWEESPVHLKDYIYLKCMSGSFLSRLLSFHNVDNIFEMILKGSTSEIRQQMIFHFEGMNLCDYLIKKNRLNLLKIFVLNCIPSIKILREFLTQYEAYAPSYQDKEMQLRKNHFGEIVKPWYEL